MNMKVIRKHTELEDGKNYFVRMKRDPDFLMIRSCWIVRGVVHLTDGNAIVKIDEPYNEKLMGIYDIIGPIDMPDWPDFEVYVNKQI